MGREIRCHLQRGHDEKHRIGSGLRPVEDVGGISAEHRQSGLHGQDADTDRFGSKVRFDTRAGHIAAFQLRRDDDRCAGPYGLRERTA